MVRTRGFTLLEVLLAVILSATVLVLLATLLGSFAETWHRRRAGDPFHEHVAGLRTFLQAALDRAEAVQATPAGEGAATGAGSTPAPTAGTAPKAGDRVAWGRPPGVGDYEEPLLSFSLPDSPPVLLAGSPPLPGLTLWLSLDPATGLTVVFRSRLALDEGEDETLLHRVLSPWLASVAYAVYDPEEDTWEETPEPPRDDSREFLVPDALILTFREPGGEEATITLHLPVTSSDALLP